MWEAESTQPEMFLQAGRSLNPALQCLIKHNENTGPVLENLVDEFHDDKDLCSYQLLNHPGSEDILWGIVRLLGSNDSSKAGHAAFIVGSLCDTDIGRRRMLEIVIQHKDSGFDILSNLTHLLYCKDGESVMNAAGTIGTLAETIEGRSWMLRKENLDDTLSKISSLLVSDNIWTGSNAALVLARLTIEEEGCARILNRRDSRKILLHLVTSLGIDESGRGMNAAFAIGRLCDMESGRRQMLMLKKCDQMLASLTSMLCSQDSGCIKNACFALGCIAGNTDGVNKLLKHEKHDKMLHCLASLLEYEDEETAWTIRTLSSKREGCLLLRDHKFVTDTLTKTSKKEDLKSDIKEEVEVTLEILKRLEKQRPPVVKIESSTTANVHWSPVNPKSGLEVTYKLFLNDAVVFSGQETSYELQNLKPTRKYSCSLQACTEGDESPISDTVSFSMPESVPSAPQNIHVINRTTTQLKIGWEPPESPNGIVKGYQIVQEGKSGFKETKEFSQIFMNLMAGTEYNFEIYALTSPGRGEKAFITCSTVDLRQHAPPKPNLNVLGRNEILVQWDPPEEPLGRINYYEVNMDGEVIYTGVERTCTARRLLPKTEYTFTVAAWTNEGKCESDPARKKTAKEKRVFPREPLYPNGKRTKNGTSIGKVKQDRITTTQSKTTTKQRCKSVSSISPSKVSQEPRARPKTSVLLRKSASIERSNPHSQLKSRVSTQMKVVRGFNVDMFDRTTGQDHLGANSTRRKQFSAGSPPFTQEHHKDFIPMFRARQKPLLPFYSSSAPTSRDSKISLDFRPSSYAPLKRNTLKKSYYNINDEAIKSAEPTRRQGLKKSVSFGTSFSRALDDLQAINISDANNIKQLQQARARQMEITAQTYGLKSVMKKTK
eukprot:gene15907-17507_t